MVKKILADKLITFIAKKFKLEKVLEYVEKPNELDVKVDKLESNQIQQGRLIEFLLKDSHPKRDFVVCDKCKKQIKEKK